MAVQTADNTNAIIDKALAAVGDLATLPDVTIKIIEIVDAMPLTAVGKVNKKALRV